MVRDADRNLVLRDRGKLFSTIRFDTLGDKEPGGELVEEKVHKVIRGSFPSVDPEFDFCEMVKQQIG